MTGTIRKELLIRVGFCTLIQCKCLQDEQQYTATTAYNLRLGSTLKTSTVGNKNSATEIMFGVSHNGGEQWASIYSMSCINLCSHVLYFSLWFLTIIVGVKFWTEKDFMLNIFIHKNSDTKLIAPYMNTLNCQIKIILHCINFLHVPPEIRSAPQCIILSLQFTLQNMHALGPSHPIS